MKICRNLRRNGYRENLSVSFFLVFLLYRKNSNPLKTFGTEVEYLTTWAKATFQQPPQLSMIKQKNWQNLNLIILDDVAEVGEGVAEISGRVLLALAVLVGMSVSKVPLEVGVGHGVAADGAATARVLEFFAYG